MQFFALYSRNPWEIINPSPVVRGVFPAEGVIDRCPRLRVSNSTLPTRVKSSLSLTYICGEKNRLDSILCVKAISKNSPRTKLGYQIIPTSTPGETDTISSVEKIKPNTYPQCRERRRLIVNRWNNMHHFSKVASLSSDNFCTP